MAFENLRIIRLEAENVKRLVAVDISPKGDVVTIAGKNGQGKTSVLDAILWAMAGGREIQWKPIRKGEARATIRVQLGNEDGLQLTVTRTFTDDEAGGFSTKLDVRSADGMKPAGAQDFLKRLVGALSFDPSAFIRADENEKIKILKGIIKAANPEADFDEIDRRRKSLYETRTEATREERRARGAAGDFDAPSEMEPLGDTGAFLDLISDAGRLAQDRARIEAQRDATRRQLRDELSDKADLEDKISDLQAQLASTNETIELLEKSVAAFEELAPLPNVDDTREKLREIEAENEAIKARNAQRAQFKLAQDWAATVKDLTAKIEACDAEVADLIASADLPVSGLELAPDYVMLRGVPFDQASDAEKLRASMALGIAANPKLRVIRIRDGSLFDEDALAIINQVAGEMNFQIWIETVGEGGPEAFVLENGMVRK